MAVSNSILRDRSDLFPSSRSFCSLCPLRPCAHAVDSFTVGQMTMTDLERLSVDKWEQESDGRKAPRTCSLKTIFHGNAHNHLNVGGMRYEQFTQSAIHSIHSICNSQSAIHSICNSNYRIQFSNHCNWKKMDTMRCW